MPKNAPLSHIPPLFDRHTTWELSWPVPRLVWAARLGWVTAPFWIITLSLALMLPRGSYGRWVLEEKKKREKPDNQKSTTTDIPSASPPVELSSVSPLLHLDPSVPLALQLLPDLVAIYRRISTSAELHPPHPPLGRWTRIRLACGYCTEKVFCGKRLIAWPYTSWSWQSQPPRELFAPSHSTPSSQGSSLPKRRPWGRRSIREVGNTLKVVAERPPGPPLRSWLPCFKFPLILCSPCRQRRAADTRLCCTDTPSSCGIPSAPW